MEITPGWETVETDHGPVRLCRGADRIVAARTGAAHDARPDHRRRDRHRRPSRIKVVHGDTDRTPYGWGTFASRSLVIAGGASLIAARKMRTKLLKIASHSARSVGRRHRARRRRGQGRRYRSRRSPIATLARAAYHQTHRFKGEIEPGMTETGDLRSRPARSPTPVMSRSSRSTSRPATSRSRNSWWPRTPAA